MNPAHGADLPRRRTAGSRATPPPKLGSGLSLTGVTPRHPACVGSPPGHGRPTASPRIANIKRALWKSLDGLLNILFFKILALWRQANESFNLNDVALS